jgi:hypothetical protein
LAPPTEIPPSFIIGTMPDLDKPGAHCATETASFVCEEHATIEDGVLVLPTGAYKGCTILQTVTLPTTLEQIGASAFSGCTSLAAVNLKEASSLQSIGSHAFSKTLLEHVALPPSLKTLGAYAFDEVRTLERAELSESSLQVIEAGTFWGCGSLLGVSLPPTLQKIDTASFYDCSALAELELPAGVHHIGEHAFRGCSSLGELALPAALVFLGFNAFRGSSAKYEVRRGVKRGETDDD